MLKNKKRIIGFIIILVFMYIFLFASREVHAKIITVDDSGGENYKNIQDAIDNAKISDTIRVYEGIYYENLIVNKTLNIIGNSSVNATIDGNKISDVIRISSNWVNISGFTIKNSGNDSLNAGINVKSEYNNISNNKLSMNNRYGILIDTYGQNRILNNIIIFNDDSGIWLNNSNNNTIFENNILLNNGDGICLFSSDNNKISNNKITSNNDNGIELYLSNNNTISDDSITLNNRNGISFFNSSTNNNIINSTITNSNNYDLYLNSSSINDTAINVTFSTINCKNNSKLIITNYLEIYIKDTNDNPIENVDIEIKNNDIIIYASSGYSGEDLKTNTNGLISWILITDRIYSNSSNALENKTYINLSKNGYIFSSLPRIVNMSTSHTEIIYENKKPIAKIDNIKPNPGNESEIIYFYGNGTDDGTISSYNWRSNLDGLLSNNNSFNISNLSNGTHTIYFKVKDNNDLWSDEVNLTITINGLPIAIIDKIKPNPSNELDKVYFFGNGTDDGTILNYEWRSSIEGFLSNISSFSISNLSNGTHTIYFKVKDSNDLWSKEVNVSLIINGIPRAKIDKIIPNPGNESEMVYFYGNGTDDGVISGYRWRSSLNGLLSNDHSFNISNLTNGTHIIYFKVKDNYNIWSDEVNLTLFINGFPKAKIDDIKNNPANEAEIVYFYGNGTDDDSIIDYYWYSSNDGFLSDKNFFNISNLTNGTHTIYFKVKDNNNLWSEETNLKITINGIPRAKIDDLKPNPANENDKVFFYGNGTDDGTITEYYWRSNINGSLSDKNSFNISNLSNGTHTIYYKIMDNNNIWSKEVNITVTINGIPKAKINEIKPNPANEHETIWFYGNGTDDGIITDYYWNSSIDGFLSYQKSFNLSNLSNGTHMIYFKVKDNNNIWGRQINSTVIINGIPTVWIDNMAPNPLNESEIVRFNGNYTDFENNITEFYWESNIDGIISNKQSFSISTLSNGTHEIIFRVKDSFGVWSENVTENLTINGIPVAIIDEILSNPANEFETVWFYGNYTDFENNITEFYWESDIDGGLSNKQIFSTAAISNGTHKITYRVKDNFGVLSENVTKIISINGIPIARIDKITPDPSNQSGTVWFYGNYTDFENNITDFYWESDIDGILDTNQNFSTSTLSNGTHKITFRVKDNFAVWSENVSENLTINGIPIAKIDEILTNPANESETVLFLGNYTDFENNITEFYWESDIVGFLSVQQIFSNSTLSNGTHKITYRVKDNYGVWSENVSENLTINGIPIAKTDEILPNPANESETVLFLGNYRDFENNITEFYWESDLDGILSNQQSFSISTLSNGTHKIIFKVKDNFAVWSENITENITINGNPRVKIAEIRPNPANESEEVFFFGVYTDFERNITEYYWESDLDGYLNNQKIFSSSVLTNGTHNITYRVKDNYGVWSDNVSEKLIINGIPIAKIDEIKPRPANESEIVWFSGNYTDFENNITEYYWESDIEGFLGDQQSFSHSNLSNGTHVITFKVKDGFGVWSIDVTEFVTINGIPRANIVQILPNFVNESEVVWFLGNYIDFENSIIEYHWESNISGNLSNQISFSDSNLLNGTHKISFRLKDNFGVWSENVTQMLTINGIPRARIDEITPKLANESEIVNFFGKYTDFENNITEFFWESDVEGYLGNQQMFSNSNLSNGTHNITFRIKDNYGVWSENVTEKATINGHPIAIIESILQNPANEGVEVFFQGKYIDFENNISEFYWESDIDGYLGNQQMFSNSTLSNGTHNISFRIKDNIGVWSENVRENITINGIPIAKIEEITPNHAIELEEVFFYGNYTDFEDNITEFFWESDIDGYLSDQQMFSNSTLSNGIHKITFKIKDRFGVWSKDSVDYLIINGIPKAKIDKIKLNPANESDIVWFYGNYTDFEENITEFYWESDIDGYLGNQQFFSNSTLSNGTHKIIFRVNDSYGIWSENSYENLVINGVPRAQIYQITPNPANESELVYFSGIYDDFENKIIEFNWKSDIDGFLSSDKTFNKLNLSAGLHNISFKVKDDNGIWSDVVYMDLEIIPKIKTPPDLTVKDDDIQILRTPIKGEMSKITTTIHNFGDINGIATVKFYDGEPSNEKLIDILNKIEVPSHNEITVIVNWTPDKKGSHLIYVLIENCEPRENNITNNQAHNKTEVILKSDTSGRGVNIISVTIIFIFLVIVIICLGYGWVKEYKRYKMISSMFLPLYVRLKKENVLNHKIREKIYGYIFANQGVDYYLIKKDLNLAGDTLAYNLTILEKEKIIKSRNDGEFKRFYPLDIKPQNVDLIISQIPLQIFKTIEDKPGISAKSLSLKLGIKTRLMKLHLKFLNETDPPFINSIKKGISTGYYINYDNNEKENNITNVVEVGENNGKNVRNDAEMKGEKERILEKEEKESIGNEPGIEQHGTGNGESNNNEKNGFEKKFKEREEDYDEIIIKRK